MNKKKILIVTATFYPANSPRANRATELAKEFARQGHDVTIVTPKNNECHIPFEDKYTVLVKDMGQPRWKAYTPKRKGIINLFERAMVRLPKLLMEYPDIELSGMVRRALKNEDGYDIMISIAVPHPVHWGVALTRRKNHPIAKIWVADCGDPYMGHENDTFRAPFYFKYVEKWFCRKADFLSVPTRGAIQGYYPEFHSKIRVISQGFDFNEFNFIQKNKKTGKPIFAYAGLFIPGRRDPTEFLNYITGLNIDFEFHIYTRSASLVEPFRERGNGRIIIHEYISRNELFEALSQMDFVINFDNIGNKQTPSKLIDYAIIGKPVLSIKTGNLDSAVINEFLTGDYTNQYHIEDVDQYRIKNVCLKFLDLCSTGEQCH